MRKLFRYLVIHPLAAILLLVLLLLAGLTVLSTTETGTGVIVKLAQRALPSLQLEGVGGTLLDRVSVDSLVWEDNGIKVEAQQAQLGVSLGARLPPVIHVQMLAADKLIINLPPSTDEVTEPFTLPDLKLPVDMRLTDIGLAELEIYQGEAVFKVRDARLGAYTDAGVLHLQQLVGELYDDTGNVQISAQGQMELAQPQALDVKLSVKGGSGTYGVGDLALTATGELQNYRVELAGDWQYADYPEYRLDVVGTGNLEGMNFEKLALRGEAGNLDLQGKLAWSPQLVWDLAASAEGLKPETFAPDVPGMLDVALTTTGRLENGKPFMQVEISRLQGSLRDYPLDASMKAGLEGDALTLHALDILVGDNRLKAQGEAGDELQVRWDLDAPDLEQLYPEINGKLQGKGKLSGKIDGSQFALDIEELTGKVLDYPLDATGGVSLQDGLITAREFQANVGKNQVKLDGIADELTGVDWVIDAPELSQLYPELQGRLKGSGNAQGLLDGSRFAVKLDELEGKVQNYPLKASGEIRMQDQLLTAKDLQVEVGNNRVSLNGVADEVTGIDWDIDAKNLTQLYPELKGNLQGKGNAQGLLDGSRFAVNIKTLEGKVQGYPLKASGGVSMSDGLLAAKDLQAEVGKNRIKLNGVADENTGIDWDIDAKNLTQLYPALKGSLKGNGKADGLLDGSRFAVSIKALEGKVQDYPLKASGEVRMKGGLLVAKDLQVDVGKNRIELDGVADEKTGIAWKIDAKNLAQLYPALKGSLTGNGKAEGLLDGSRFALKINELTGKVQDYPLQASGEVRMKDQLLVAKNLQVGVGDNQVRLDGVADERTGIDWQIDAKNLAQLAPQLKGSLKGKGNAQGLLDGSRFSVKIDELGGKVQDYPLRASGSISLKNQRLAAKKLQLDVGNNRLELNGVADEKTGLAWMIDANNLAQLYPELKGDLQGNGTAQGRLDGSSFAVKVAALNGSVQGYPVSASGGVSLKNQLLTAKNLVLNVGNNQVQLDGVADEKTGINWRVDAKNLTQLAPQLQGNLQGNGNARGLLDGSRFAVKVNDLQGNVQGYPLRASGEVSMKNKVLSANNLLADVGQNRVRLNGSAGDRLGLNWELDAKNLSQLYPAINGSVQGNGTLAGKVDGSQLDLNIARLQGQIEGRPLQVVGGVNIQGDKINVRNLQVLAGDNRLEVNGQASEPFNLTWKVNARNLAQAWPGLAGNLQGEGVVRGNLDQPQVQGSLKGSQLAFQDMRVARLDVQIKQNGAQYDIRGSLGNLSQGLNGVNSADFTAQGLLTNHTVTLAVVHKDGKADLRARGGLNNGQWQGALETLALRDTPAGNWQLTNPVKIAASAKAVSASNACLANQQGARICAKTDWSEQGGAIANGTLQQVPLSMARSFLPNTIQLPGVVNGDYRFEQRGGRPFAQVNIQLPDNTVTILGERGKKETLQYTNARANVTLNDNTATLQAQLDIRGRGQLKADGRIDLSPGNGQHRIDARATVTVPDIAWLQTFSPQIDELKGQLNGDVRVTGLLSQPQVTGVVRLQGGSVFLPETGARLQDINLTAQANRPDQMAITGSLRAGQGLMNANGILNLANLPNWTAELKVQGSDLLLMNTHEVQAKISPDLTIQATAKKVNITGTVRIPEATISLRELPVGASVRSDDIVIVGREQPQSKGKAQVVMQEEGDPIEILPNVLIELGDRVKISGFGLDARLSGKLRILRNRQDVVAEGVLSVINGVYKAYGQDLTIERGRLLFNGPLDNPGLDVRAVRNVEDDIRVGIALGGSVQKPESTLFSSPQQTQTDTLSYLLTGRALSGVSGGQSAILTQAVTGLGLAGGESLAQNLGGQLGLDDVGLNANGGDFQQSELSLGKRLGPKLYIKYIVGLFDSLQRIAITYDINKRLQVEATTGVEQSLDLIYKLDTDTGPFGN